MDSNRITPTIWGTADNPTIETIVRIAEACGYFVCFKKKAEYKKTMKADSRNKPPEKANARRKKMG